MMNDEFSIFWRKKRDLVEKNGKSGSFSKNQEIFFLIKEFLIKKSSSNLTLSNLNKKIIFEKTQYM